MAGRGIFDVEPNPIQVEGLKGFIRSLREVEPRFAREFTKAEREVAMFVRDEAKLRAEAVGGVARKVAPSIKASGTVKGAFVMEGGDSYPYTLGAEFGGGAYGLPPAAHPQKWPGGGHTTQFKEWRGSGPDAGYILFPTVRLNHEEIIKRFESAVLRVAEEAFPK